jgi:hypothetical protein
MYTMKKQTLWLLLIGNLCMSFTLFTNPIMKVPVDLGDFIKGFGVALVFGALYVQKKLERKVAAAIDNSVQDKQ